MLHAEAMLRSLSPCPAPDGRCRHQGPGTADSTPPERLNQDRRREEDAEDAAGVREDAEAEEDAEDDAAKRGLEDANPQ